MYIQFAESVIPSGTGTFKNNSALKGSEVQFLLPYIKIRVSKFAVENVFNSNATIVVLNSTKTTAINDNEKNLAKNEEKLTSS